MFMNKDGSKIDLDISVPQGWSDWEAARDMIVSSAEGRGDPAHRQGEGLQHLAERSQHGQLRPRDRQQLPAERQPVDVLERHLPPPDHQLGNGPDVRELRAVQQPRRRGRSSRSWTRRRRRNTAAIKAINTQLQTTLMQDLPLIPLWYNGIWAQFTTKVWTNWPAAAHQPPVHSRHVARLPPDDGHRHDHAPDEHEVGSETVD